MRGPRCASIAELNEARKLGIAKGVVPKCGGEICWMGEDWACGGVCGVLRDITGCVGFELLIFGAAGVTVTTGAG